MSESIEAAKRVLSANMVIPFGIFGVIASCPYFPPKDFLNRFLEQGNDPCDQDERMSRWAPFTLSSEEYLEVKAWWVETNPGVAENSLGVSCWEEWVQEILNH